ncbi:MAG: DDE-type integrase/transposase/recombinase [Magnetococcales bacterium]|nr:DDE-type integrase/transposase/recombinase [Magnetococcales bacterium]
MSNDMARLEILSRVASDHAAAAWREKGKIIDAGAQRLGCSRQTVFRWLADLIGYDPGRDRKPRADKGSTTLPEESLRTIAGLAFVSRRGTGKQLLSLEGAATVARANGLEVPVSVTTVARQLRQHGMHPRQLTAPTPHVHQQSRHPNHVWFVDASLSVLYYMGDSTLEAMNEDVFYKNKPQNFQTIAKKRLNRYVVVDHYSGAFYLEYRLGGESQENITEVFMNAIIARPGDPFCGVPLLLGMDPGSANLSQAFLNLLRNLEVETLVHTPGNSRAKGVVEVMQRIVEHGFEWRLRHEPVTNLGHINLLARQWSLDFNNAAVHSRHGQSRFMVWGTITAEQFRPAPSMALLKELWTSTPIARHVDDDLTLSFKVKGWSRFDYDVRYIPGVMVKEKLLVRVNPYRAPAVDVRVPGEEPERWLTVQPIPKNEAGFFIGAAMLGEEYKAMPETMADRARKALNAAAYGVESPSEAEKRRRQNAPVYAGVIDAFADLNVTPFSTPIQTHPIHSTVVVPIREAAPLDAVSAAIALRERMGRNLEQAEFERLTSCFPNGVSESELDGLQREFSDQDTPRLRAVGGAAC